MTVLMADVARDALSAFLQAQMPAQIAAVNGLRSAKHQLEQITTWTASPLVATPEPPALGILMQTSGFRGTQLGTTLDEQHAVHVYLQAGNLDEETLQSDLIGYAAALVNCILLPMKGLAAIGSGVQALFGAKGGDAEDVLVFGPSQPAANLFYGDVTLILTLFNTEAV